jgi:hypothetical protein
MDVRHPLEDLAHEQLGDRMGQLEVFVHQQAAKVVIGIRKDHEHVPSSAPISGRLCFCQLAHKPNHWPNVLRSTTISMMGTIFG